MSKLRINSLSWVNSNEMKSTLSQLKEYTHFSLISYVTDSLVHSSSSFLSCPNFGPRTAHNLHIALLWPDSYIACLKCDVSSFSMHLNHQTAAPHMEDSLFLFFPFPSSLSLSQADTRESARGVKLNLLYCFCWKDYTEQLAWLIMNHNEQEERERGLHMQEEKNLKTTFLSTSKALFIYWNFNEKGSLMTHSWKWGTLSILPLPLSSLFKIYPWD